MSGHSFRGGDEFAIDNEQAVIESFEKRLDDDRAAMLFGFFEAGLDFERIELERYRARQPARYASRPPWPREHRRRYRCSK